MNKAIVFLFSCFLFFSFSSLSYGQYLAEIKKKEFKTEEAGFDNAWKYLQAGDVLFMDGRGTYKEALKLYLSAHEYNSLNPELNYRIGVCYLFSDQKYKAIEYLNASYEFNKYVAPDIHLFLAMAYHLDYKFDQAIDEYQVYLKGLTRREIKIVDTLNIKNAIQQCYTGLEIMQDTNRVKIINLGVAINSEDDDYKPVFSKSLDRMYFTSRRTSSPDEKRNELDNKFNENIYVAYSSNDSLWNKAQNIGEPINSKENTAALLLTDDGETLYFYQGKKSGGEIFKSFRVGGIWNKPQKVKSKINSGSHESSVSVTEDHKTLYFVSDREKGGYGGLDIWVSDKDENDNWSEPRNLGSGVNTSFNEEAVYLAPDQKTMFFSSNRPESMGGYDIFKTVLENGVWSTPVNLGYPVNSPDNDLFYVVQDSLIAYISSIRRDNIGLMDIYKVMYIPEVIVEEAEIDEPPVEVIVPVVIAKPDHKIQIAGTVRDASDSTGIQGMIEIIDMEVNKIVATTISSKETGEYSLKLKRKSTYGVEVNAAGYMFYLDIMEIPEDTSLTEIHRDFNLNMIKVGEKIVLKNIFFEFNKSTLSKESFTELDRVTDFLEKNSELRIEISGHTDNVGSADYNQRLSEGRAKAVVEYLVSKGVESSRLEFVGYGFEQPMASNDTEEGRAANRRVEFKVIE
ncbi:MAG: OmpA family protein [Bacteroidota bacterium]|nr:OmpA family protein [Bacteroidota bacterium]